MFIMWTNHYYALHYLNNKPIFKILTYLMQNYIYQTTVWAIVIHECYKYALRHELHNCIPSNPPKMHKNTFKKKECSIFYTNITMQNFTL